jgi:hypothetical protein
MTKNDRAREFKTNNPKVKGKRSIASELFRLYPEEFESLEAARSAVRRITGSAGERERNKIKSPELIKFFYNGFDKWAQENLNTEIAPWHEPFIIPTSIKKLSVIADLHSVHLNHEVLKAFLRSTKDKTAVLLNGDLLDSESLSRHLKGHNVIEYQKELDLCHQILKGLKEEFNHVYYKEGNHCFWLERYLLTNAREIFKLLGIGLKELLKLDELGVHHIHNLKWIQYGDCSIIHGHEFPGFGSGKFPATGILDKWQTFTGRYDVKVLAAHSHRADEAISKRSKDGKFGYGYVMPAMCRKGAHYNPYAGWDNGWAELEIIDGKTDVKLIKI